MQKHPANPLYSIKSIIRNRNLLFQLIKRQVAERYRGSALGILWSLATPLLMLFIYSFVFVYVFQARFGADAPRAHGDFAVILFSGLILHQFLAEILSRAPTLILENANFVKKVVFPLEILAPAQVASAFFQLTISFLVLFCGIILIFGALPLTVLYVPLILLPFILLALGAGWLLSATGVFLRDIGHIMPVLTTIMLFMSTVFYPADTLPPLFRAIIYLNPLSLIADNFRAVAIYGKTPDLYAMGIYLIASIAIYSAGFYWFQKTRKSFADVM